jgi:hypothetical protein
MEGAYKGAFQAAVRLGIRVREAGDAYAAAVLATQTATLEARDAAEAVDIMMADAVEAERCCSAEYVCTLTKIT